MKKSRIAPQASVSLRKLAMQSEDEMSSLMREYYPLCLEAFPMEGEVETLETFLEDVQEPDSTWDVIVLKDEKQNIIGGIHFQVLSLEGVTLDKVAWVEHVWVKREHRSFKNFRELVRICRNAIKANQGKIAFLEFHNPRKMTRDQIVEAAQSGITCDGALKLLKRAGVCVAVTAAEEIAAYGQPSMDGQPAVEYFSAGFVSDQSLAGQTLSRTDYLSIMHAAHLTIHDVDLDKDPTVVAYTKEVEASGDFIFKTLSEAGL